jgi:hypothetical protein
VSYFVLYFDGHGSGPRVEGAHLELTAAQRLFSKVAFFKKCHEGDDTTRLGADGGSVELCEHLAPRRAQ